MSATSVNKIKYYFLRLVIAFHAIMVVVLLSGCASTGTLTGGAKDILPPVLDTVLSTPNRQLNFRPKQLNFFFDEFVEVRDPIKQVLVSPPLTYIPQVKHRGKRVTFTFDEKEALRENATYTINFGEAIVDFHEGNKLGNFAYVFATGPVLDSLNLKGKIVDALTGEPDPDMVVFLYDNLQDSVVRKEKPFYFARPDKSGNFIFQNVKSDTFRIFAVKDENINYKYDLPAEKIAFLDTLIVLNAAYNSEIRLRSSLPKPKIKILSVNAKTYGKVNIAFNTSPPSDINYGFSSRMEIHTRELINDSLNIYYETSLDSFSIYVLNDTLKIKPKGKADFLKKAKLKRVYANNSPQMLPGDSLVIKYNLPLKNIIKDKITVYDTIGQIDDISVDLAMDDKSIIIKYPWSPGESYVMDIDSAALKSYYGQSNDSLALPFTILTPAKTGTLKLIVADLDSMFAYIINVKRDKNVIISENVSNKSKHQIVIKGLVPDRYNVEIIRDDNKNGQWDPADYWTKQQPEYFRLFKGDKLRENWETEMNVSWTQVPAPANEPINGLKGFKKQ